MDLDQTHRGTPRPSPRTVAGWILRHPDSLSEVDQLRLKAVMAPCPELEALAGHVRSLAQNLTERQGQRLPECSTQSAKMTCPASAPSPPASIAVLLAP
ncbi:hypothetical protein ACFVTC_42305 [Streptomyces sp. NPDC057950]|uniref:hypothetical protein n=1 Tax=Streptomyces sp. NPDC057950 TaxID=3346288 RepID=UPI0036E81315